LGLGHVDHGATIKGARQEFRVAAIWQSVIRKRLQTTVL
jgi:hypothetical protein